ncbi:MAG: BTAD domain-containing putative transcriptional regulator [Geodermatophilaceae bacterium]
MRLHVLGNVEAVGGDGEPVRLGTLQRALLAALLARVGDVVATEHLVDLVWGDRPPADPEGGVHSQVSRLRRSLLAANQGERRYRVEILTRPPGYLLSASAGQIDAQRFATMVEEARHAPPHDAAKLLEDALGLWRGRAYGEFADVDVARFAAIRLEVARLVAFEAWSAALLGCGRAADALPVLEAFVAEHPLREEGRMLLMRALCAVGRHADALAGYRGYRDVLAEDAGLEPSTVIQRLEMQILRRELPQPAAAVEVTGPPGEAPVRAPALPAPLTAFVGRAAERMTLAASLAEHRMVTAVGPGGVGKTRLALTLAADLSDRHADGSSYVDLVPVTDPSMVAPAVAVALGLSRHEGRSAEDTVVAWLHDRDCLLVLDNCEHLAGGVIALVERLLAECSQLVVLATSRARLMVPFEWTFPVPGLSVSAPGEGQRADAVALFHARAAAAGARLVPGDDVRIAAICTRLDGMALAIELAAARLPTLGLDGLEAGLADRLRLLTGGHRVDNRHRSLRSALDWSYALLSDVDQAVLRRVSMFAAPFTATAAADVVGGLAPVPRGEVAACIARLADQSLLTTVEDPANTRYRVLETIRQYGAEFLVAAGESDGVSSRHHQWCLEVGAALRAQAGMDRPSWRPAFDRVADDLRAALAWAAHRPSRRGSAYTLATMLAELTFSRGMPGESQRRYEQAAELVDDEATSAAELRRAAAAALSRHVGDDAVRLFRKSADTAIRCGDRPGAARDLAKAAEMLSRAAGLMATAPSAERIDALIAEARALAGADLTAQAQVLCAEAFRLSETDPRAWDLAEEAITLARAAGDPVIQSAALDLLTSAQLARGDLRGAAASSLRRTELLAPLPVRAEIGLELSDAYHMACESALAAGDLAGARRLAEASRDLPFHREEGHLATSRLIIVTALSGEWAETATLSERFLDGWDRAGRPRAGNHRASAFAAATVYGLRGDEHSRTAWLEVVASLATPGRPAAEQHYGEFFDAWLLLHRGQHDEALDLMRTAPEMFRNWHNGRWLPWYAALWAEAAVLSAHPDADDRIHRARRLTKENPIAAAIVDRAAALPGGNQAGILAAAEALASAGCRYQWARTLLIAGGSHTTTGLTEMAAINATPMAPGPFYLTG